MCWSLLGMANHRTRRAECESPHPFATGSTYVLGSLAASTNGLVPPGECSQGVEVHHGALFALVVRMRQSARWRVEYSTDSRRKAAMRSSTVELEVSSSTAGGPSSPSESCDRALILAASSSMLSAST